MLACRPLMTRRAAARAIAIGSALTLVALTAEAQTTGRTAFDAMDGDDLYQAACAACHGADGRGAPPPRSASTRRFPTSPTAAFATPEADADWFAVAHDGGPSARSIGGCRRSARRCTEASIERTLDYIRGFCAEPRLAARRAEPAARRWSPRRRFPRTRPPHAPRATATGRAVTNELLYERRLGARSQFEVAVPLAMQRGRGQAVERGLGDVAVALKHVLVHSLGARHDPQLAGEVRLPTGKETSGLGGGVTKFEPFVAFGQLLPADAFVQLQVGRRDLDRSRPRRARGVLARRRSARPSCKGEFGRAWTPMVEFARRPRALDGGAVEWDVVPQMQVSLSRRQHILVSGGVRVPVTARGGRATQILAYLLWDWFDGGLLEGWR